MKVMVSNNTKAKHMIVDCVASVVCHYCGLEGAMKTTMHMNGTEIEYVALPFHDPKYLTSVYTRLEVLEVLRSCRSSVIGKGKLKILQILLSLCLSPSISLRILGTLDSTCSSLWQPSKLR
jgi:hypothetical protein